MYNLNGKVALVTGAGGEQGIGRAICQRLAKEGCDLVVNDLHTRPYTESGWGGLPALVEEIEASGQQAFAVAADVSNADQVSNMIQQAIERFGHIDILVNNAGSRPGPDRVPVVELSEAAWDQVQNVNAKGTFLCAQAVARHMIERGGGGKIVNISSTAGRLGMPRFAAYCASKFAVIGFTQSLAHELAEHKINVNAVCPGTTLTERTGYIAAALNEQDAPTQDATQTMVGSLAEQTPLGRVAEPEDVARTVAFLASAESDYTTGVALLVAGGIQM
ncbi:MAG: 3-oxoacyl-ACP reductase FabG [Gemmatimonadetes bacterium]|nr:3-oxoacyl-ACP reductase FabG [Gemmatimonadota bacterium]MBT5451606.1 3-oxoacyl-ACP reductase FabG [Gemmatimonadota bacterium]MBT5805660.1 3-oxoacyl-ACP reductase FabG [Gemmatimonadota bacterium]MBT6623731.1 3-oxoacyl-ACP reductase FabG [Gemmatimonadota bacterium]MBT6902576.1 3-oxoacyl-ACP reductase FabG [Gemmatimonadota bacterium]